MTTRTVEREDELLTVDEVAAWLRYHPDHVRRLTKQGKIPFTRPSWAYRYRRGDIAALVVPESEASVA